MKDLAIVAAAGVIAYLIFSRLPVKQSTVYAQPLGSTRLQIPDVFVAGGGWMPDGSYAPNITQIQEAEGWGYGD